MYDIVIQWLMGQKQMISTTLMDILSSLKEIVIFLKHKNTHWYFKKKILNMQISATFLLYKRHPDVFWYRRFMCQKAWNFEQMCLML